MTSLEKFFARATQRHKNRVELADALLSGRLAGYVWYRLRFFLILQVVAIALHFVEYGIFRAIFSQQQLVTMVLLKDACVLLGGFFWGRSRTTARTDAHRGQGGARKDAAALVAHRGVARARHRGARHGRRDRALALFLRLRERVPRVRARGRGATRGGSFRERVLRRHLRAAAHLPAAVGGARGSSCSASWSCSRCGNASARTALRLGFSCRVSSRARCRSTTRARRIAGKTCTSGVRQLFSLRDLPRIPLRQTWRPGLAGASLRVGLDARRGDAHAISSRSF